jgi:hypothetical protein
MYLKKAMENAWSQKLSNFLQYIIVSWTAIFTYQLISDEENTMPSFSLVTGNIGSVLLWHG